MGALQTQHLQLGNFLNPCWTSNGILVLDLPFIWPSYLQIYLKGHYILEKKNGRYISYSMHFLSEWWEKTRALAQVFLNIFEKIVKYTKLACVNWRSFLKIYMGIKVREVVECKMELETCENGVDYYYCSNGSFSHHYFLHFISLHM